VRARSALFTMFGDVVRPAGGWAWLSTLTELMGALGFTPEATRTALHRMTAEDWVAPRKQGRYARYQLTSRGVDRLEEAAARIYRLREAPWDGRWRLLALVSGRADTRGDLGRALGWTGHGRLSGELWVSPHPPGEGVAAILAEHGHADAHRFTAEAGDAAHDRRIVEEAWDLAELRAAQRSFLARWHAEPVATEPQDAFRQRMQLVHHWRSFLFLDPGLPEPLLPADWLGHDAAALFRRRYEALEESAWVFVEGVAAAAPAGTTPEERRQPVSPFSLGLPV
jgi:phenylacetic acid degradation operon negative regulatory protein